MSNHMVVDMLFQEGAININDLTISKHVKDKGHMMMVSHQEMEIEKDKQKDKRESQLRIYGSTGPKFV